MNHKSKDFGVTDIKVEVNPCESSHLLKQRKRTKCGTLRNTTEGRELKGRRKLKKEMGFHMAQ